MMILIVFFCVLIASLAICGVSSFKIQKDKLLVFVTLKGFSVLSILLLAITSSNLASNMSGTTLFILLALAFQIFSAIISVLPTKNDLFAPLYYILDACTSLCLALSGLLFVPLSPFGLPIGFGVGLIVALTYALIKKQFNWKIDLAHYSIFIFATALLAQIPIILLATQTIQAIIFSVGALLFFVYSIFKTFIITEEKRFVLCQNILYYLALITLAVSIFTYLY